MPVRNLSFKGRLRRRRLRCSKRNSALPSGIANFEFYFPSPASVFGQISLWACQVLGRLFPKPRQRACAGRVPVRHASHRGLGGARRRMPRLLAWAIERCACARAVRVQAGSLAWVLVALSAGVFRYCIGICEIGSLQSAGSHQGSTPMRICVLT